MVLITPPVTHRNYSVPTRSSRAVPFVARQDGPGRRCGWRRVQVSGHSCSRRRAPAEPGSARSGGMVGVMPPPGHRGTPAPRVALPTLYRFVTIRLCSSACQVLGRLYTPRCRQKRTVSSLPRERALRGKESHGTPREARTNPLSAPAANGRRAHAARLGRRGALLVGAGCTRGCSNRRGYRAARCGRRPGGTPRPPG